MKKLLLLFTTVFTAGLAFSQVLFTVEDPENLKGSYPVSYSTQDNGWNSPDMTDSDNAIIGSLVYAKDGTAADSLACETIQNTDEFFSGEVTGFSLTNPGSGYLDGNVSGTGGTGTGLTFDIVASPIVGVDSLDAGSLVDGEGYETANGVATTGGSGSGLTVDIVANPIGGVDTLDLSILPSGTGYDETIGASTSTNGAGTGLTVDIYTDAGAVDSVVINEMGEGYGEGDEITILVGDGNATLTVTSVTNGEVTSVIPADLGTDYVAGDVITIDGGNGEATIEVLTVVGGNITSIEIADIGQGYTEGDEVTISAGDMNAVVTVEKVSLDKIAILYRGECQFGTKALNAQNAGAIACVIINQEPGGVIGMLGGDDGPNVNIPVFMISLSDGQKVIQAMKSDDVNVFIGNKTGFYANDVGTTNAGLLRAKSLSTPSFLAETGDDFNFELGAWVYNYGFQDQTNVKLKASVTFEGDTLYSEVSTPLALLEARDSSFLTLSNFSSGSYDVGEYTLTYEVVSDSIDDYQFDNIVNSKFNINDEFMFTYSNVDDTTGLPTSSGIGYPSNLESCIVFSDENASKVIPTGVSFSAFNLSTQFTIEGAIVNVNVYKWNDPFDDLNDDETYFNLVEVSSGTYQYEDSLLESVPVVAEVEPFAFEDGGRYLFCVTSFVDSIYIMYDRINYTENVKAYQQPIYSIGNSGDYFTHGEGLIDTQPVLDIVPAIGIQMADVKYLNVKKEEISYNMNAYPSPASSKVTVDFNGHDVSNVEVLSLAGQSVRSQEVKNGQMNTEVDVNGLDNGLYIFKVYLSNGMVSTMNVVVNH